MIKQNGKVVEQTWSLEFKIGSGEGEVGGLDKSG